MQSIRSPVAAAAVVPATAAVGVGPAATDALVQLTRCLRRTGLLKPVMASSPTISTACRTASGAILRGRTRPGMNACASLMQMREWVLPAPPPPKFPRCDSHVPSPFFAEMLASETASPLQPYFFGNLWNTIELCDLLFRSFPHICEAFGMDSDTLTHLSPTPSRICEACGAKLGELPNSPPHTSAQVCSQRRCHRGQVRGPDHDAGHPVHHRA